MKDIDDPMRKMLQKIKKKEGGSDNDSDIPAWYLFFCNLSCVCVCA